MRAHHALAVVAILLIGFGVKVLLFSPRTAEADTRIGPSPTLDNSRMHENKKMPDQPMHDMSFVYSDGD